MDQNALNRLYLQRLKLDLLNQRLTHLYEWVRDPYDRAALRDRRRHIEHQQRLVDRQVEVLDPSSEQLRRAHMYVESHLVAYLETLLAREVGAPSYDGLICLRLHHDELGSASYVGEHDHDVKLLQQVFHTDRIHPARMAQAEVYAKYQGYTLVTAETTVG